MVELLNFFEPVELNQFEDTSFINDSSSIGNNLIINSPTKPITENTRIELAFFTVNQYLQSENPRKVNSPQIIREEFYRLKKTSSGLHIADFGNLRLGKNINETIFALQEVSALFLHQNIKVIIIGGSQLLTSGSFNALKEFENNINLVHIDSRIDLSVTNESVKECHYLNRLIENEAAYLYNITCVGYQSYFVDAKQLKILDENYFEHYRLGTLRTNFSNIEPVFRDADIVSFDISSVRVSEAPAQFDGSPNGLYADEACRLARYAGISDRLRIFGIYNIECQYDNNRQTAKLVAQATWYFLDGYKHRNHNYKNNLKENCIKYEVQIDEIDFPIVFLKNNHSNQWWINVKGIKTDDKAPESVFVSCTEADYSMACLNEIPERWWINFKKMK